MAESHLLQLDTHFGCSLRDFQNTSGTYLAEHASDTYYTMFSPLKETEYQAF